MLIRSTLCIVMFLVTFAVQAEPKGPEEFLKIYQTGLKVEKEKAAEALAWAGLSSPQLFDLVEKEVLDGYKSAKTNIPVNYVSWQVRALGFSGNEKYHETIKTVLVGSPSKKVKKYAKMALRDISRYKALNDIIAPKSWPKHKHPELTERLINMLKSDNFELKKMGAKRIHYSHNYQPILLAKLDEEIKKNYQNKMDSDLQDSFSWMCKALAGSRTVEYRPTIQAVAKGAKNKKLRSHAKKYLRYYDS